MDIESDASSGAAEAWPPRGAPLTTDEDLPGAAYVIMRLGWRHVAPVIAVPLLVYLEMFRVGSHSGAVITRLVNPGVLGLLAVSEALLIWWCLARRGRAVVAATYDWVAARGLFVRPWRSVAFADVARFSARPRRPVRGLALTGVTMACRDGRRVSLSLNGDGAALPALLARLRSAGAVEVDSGTLRPFSRGRAAALTALFLGVIGLPITYVALGPLRLLPAPLAGAFTWSGCRASLAAEDQPPVPREPWVDATTQAGAEAWSLFTTVRVDAAQYAQQTRDPAARLAHLREDGFLVATQSYLKNPQGAVLDVEMLRFGSPQGALAYDSYVNRAVCEQEWSGVTGPRSTEVHLRRGRAAVVRWVAGTSVIEVGQTDSTPFSTSQQVDAVADSLHDAG